MISCPATKGIGLAYLRRGAGVLPRVQFRLTGISCRQRREWFRKSGKRNILQAIRN